MIAPLVVAAAWQTVRRRGASPLRGGKARAAALPALVLAATFALNLIPIPGHGPGRPHRQPPLHVVGRFKEGAQQREAEGGGHRLRPRELAPGPRRRRAPGPVPPGQSPTSAPGCSTSPRPREKRCVSVPQDDGEVVVEIGERKEVVAPVIEQTISSALIRLVRRAPQTLCGLEGNGERRLDSEALGGFQLARLTAERNGIATRGLDLTVTAAIPPDCTILVMAAPTVALLPNEIQVINDWMAKNGKMLILSRAGRGRTSTTSPRGGGYASSPASSSIPHGPSPGTPPRCWSTTSRPSRRCPRTSPERNSSRPGGSPPRPARTPG